MRFLIAYKDSKQRRNYNQHFKLRERKIKQGENHGPHFICRWSPENEMYLNLINPFYLHYNLGSVLFIFSCVCVCMCVVFSD